MIAEYNHHRSVPVSTARVARRLSFPRRARASIIHAMTRISLLRPLPSSVRLGLVALGLAGTSLGAQARSDSLPASGSTQAPATLTITPRRPEIGSLVLLSLRRSKASGDSILTISGRMAGEPLHFR